MNGNFIWGFYDRFNTLYNINVNFNMSLDYYKELKSLLHIKTLKDYEITRVGMSNKDGGYIMVNDFNGGIAYSFGICDDVSWDSIMAELGYDIYMYDHTIQGLPYSRDEFHFFKEGISGKDEAEQPLKTLKYYMERNNHSDNKNMILKMDVEGAEWDFLETVDEKILEQFDQILFEYHELIQPKRSKQILKLLKKLNKTHQLVHLHGNNSGYILKIGDTFFPDVLEATYVNKKTYKTQEPEMLNLPLSIDAPNDIGRPDVPLGNWNEMFVTEEG